MICFRDMTFCPAEECLSFESCPRALTDKVKADAEQWWGDSGAPICLYVNPPELPCYNVLGGAA